MSDARKILDKEGFGQYTDGLEPGLPHSVPAGEDTWYFAIPAAITMRDVSCGIWHDGKTVLGARESEM
jgi:hypothetical protein